MLAASRPHPFSWLRRRVLGPGLGELIQNVMELRKRCDELAHTTPQIVAESSQRKAIEAKTDRLPQGAQMLHEQCEDPRQHLLSLHEEQQSLHQEQQGLLKNIENGLENKIAASQQNVINYLAELRKSLVTMELHSRLAAFEARRSEPDINAAKSVPLPRAEPSLDATMAMLERRHPRLYPVWRELLEAGERSYRENQRDNLSVYDNPGSVIFRSFCLAHLRDAVLDIGCGPVAVPIYLDGYDLARVAGIDPFGSPDRHPFAFVRAVAEQIPWADESFETVVVATSLDHLLDLELGVQEISRVLKPKGQLIAWVYYIPGMPRYNPFAPDVGKVDEFHLFHFDRPWFLELISRHFWVLEEINLDGFSHFYRFLRKPDSTASDETKNAVGAAPI
jgi:SAM-dependent methyltransferase